MTQLTASVVLDVAIVVVVALAAVGGWRAGLTVFVLRLAGMVLGVAGGLWLAASLTAMRMTSVSHLILQAGCMLAGALIGSMLGARAGRVIGALLARLHLGWANRLTGALARAGTGLLACGLLIGPATAVGPPAVAAAVRDSTVVPILYAVLPPPAQVVTALARSVRMPASLTSLAAGPERSQGRPAYLKGG